MSEPLYIHIRNFGRFQRFQDRKPSWIRLHLDLLENDAFMELTERQKWLLITLWITYGRNVRPNDDLLFTECRGIPHRTSTLARLAGHRVFTSDLERLNHAGFITVSGTETVTIGAKKRPLDVKKEDKNLARAREDPDQDPQPEPSGQLDRAEAFTKNAGCQYEQIDYEAELARYGLTPDEYDQVHALYDHLRPKALAEQNGQPEPLPYVGVEPPVVAE